MPRGSDSAVILVRKTERGVHASGQPHFFRGHTIPRRAGQRRDGIYGEWHWDGEELTVRNDRYGVLPLFFAERKDWLAVSPSIATLLEHGAPADLDEAALAVFFRLGFF